MNRPKIVILTKTLWSEPPRLRHQVTNLMIEMGYDVIFFERPTFKKWLTIEKKENITFVRHFELVHHRLRFNRALVKINAFFTKFFIRKSLRKLRIEKSEVINFSYDYYFLHNLFENTVVTIINDDFVNKIKNTQIRRITELQLSKTAQNSSINLAVSYPLRDQLRQFTDKTELFFPWAESKYQKPKEGAKRDVALFFGYINYRLDWQLVLGVLKEGLKVRFIGPVESSVNATCLKEAESYPNAEFLPSMSIDKIDFSDVCCSILPWDNSLMGVQAITINNKCFNLLAYGIPQIYSDLPNLIEADKRVIDRCATASEFVKSIQYFADNFENCQPLIEEFLKMHYSDKRKLQLKSILKTTS